MPIPNNLPISPQGPFIPSASTGGVMPPMPGGPQEPIVGASPSTAAPNMSPEEMKANLGRKLAGVENKQGAYESERYVARNKLRELKISILNKIFATMKSIGVDPGDRESVNMFLQKLETQDPDLFALFESAMNAITAGLDESMVEKAEQGEALPEPGGALPEPGGALPEQQGGLMDRFKGLQENILRQ